MIFTDGHRLDPGGANLDTLNDFAFAHNGTFLRPWVLRRIGQGLGLVIGDVGDTQELKYLE